MKTILLLLACLVGVKSFAITIDEAGQSRPHPKKPSITVKVEVDTQATPKNSVKK